MSRCNWRSSRIYHRHPVPSEQEIEVVHLLACGETLEDLSAKYGVSRKAMVTRLWRMRHMFGASTTIELVASFVAHGWIALPRYEGAPACLRSECESCPVAHALVRL